MSILLLAAAYALCPAQGLRENCVHDGDTFWRGREKIRIANIDAPELHGRCPSESRKALLARNRLLLLLNSGAVVVHRSGQDVYGRTLATIHVDGADVGQRLMSDGLAREWQGSRRSWC